jgi:hypothetical protein
MLECYIRFLPCHGSFTLAGLLSEVYYCQNFPLDDGSYGGGRSRLGKLTGRHSVLIAQIPQALDD